MFVFFFVESICKRVVLGNALSEPILWSDLCEVILLGIWAIRVFNYSNFVLSFVFLHSLFVPLVFIKVAPPFDCGRRSS